MATSHSTLKNKITVYNDQTVHPIPLHLLQLLLIYLSLEVVNLSNPGRGYSSQSRASSSLYGPTQLLLKVGALVSFQPSSAVPNSFRPSRSISDMSLIVPGPLINIVIRQPGC